VCPLPGSVSSCVIYSAMDLDNSNPTDPDTYELPYETFDVSTVKRVEDLPVWDKGCDSSYTWAKKYRHLMGQATASELADRVTDIMRNDSNPKVCSYILFQDSINIYVSQAESP
jgi:hypothetical protein